MDLFEFDPKKNRSNLEKHGVDFPTAARIWDGFVVEREDDRRDYGEMRFLSLGMVDDGRIVLVVHTWRGKNRRLISARKANSDEQEVYRAALAKLEAGAQD